MRLRLARAALLLPLAGCVVPPDAGPAPYPYPPPGYPTPYAQPDLAYPGYAYNNGSPTLFIDGVTWPLVFYGGVWGYWDGYHRWHGAPDPVGGWLAARHPGGAGYRPYGGGQWGRPGGWGGGGAYGPAAGSYRPGAVAPGGFRPGVAPGAYRPGVVPGGYRPSGGGGVRPAAAPARQAPQREHEEHH
jgi:hypothetical protein